MSCPDCIVRITAPDKPGLVATITSHIAQVGGNVIETHEHVETPAQRFFMRTEVTNLKDPAALAVQLQQALGLDAKVECVCCPARPNIVILVTKEYHCLGDLLLRHEHGDLAANIQAVVSNHATLEPLVQRFGLPFHAIPNQNLDRQQHEQALLSCLQNYEFDYLVLAKYMRILSPQFVAQFPAKIINIHHSFLPAFIGASPYQQAYARGVKIIGATAHFVTDDLDEGPIITQQVVPVNHSHHAKDMAKLGRDVEKITLCSALDLVLELRVMVHHNKTIIFS